MTLTFTRVSLVPLASQSNNIYIRIIAWSQQCYYCLNHPYLVLFPQWAVVCWLAHIKQSLWHKVFQELKWLQKPARSSKKPEDFLLRCPEIGIMFSMNTSSDCAFRTLGFFFNTIKQCWCYNQRKLNEVTVLLFDLLTLGLSLCLSSWCV